MTDTTEEVLQYITYKLQFREKFGISPTGITVLEIAKAAVLDDMNRVVGAHVKEIDLSFHGEKYKQVNLTESKVSRLLEMMR